MSDATVQQLGPGLWVIDHHFLGVPGIIASYLLAGEDGLTLIETGPTPTLGTLRSGIRAAGFAPEQITQIAVTHIHLDHAGAAGVLMRELPQARLLVHPAGAPHLIDPTKLLASAGRLYGADMDRLWGEVIPVPAARVRTLADGETFRAGGRELTALDTPGHANHHLAYYDPASGDVFTGDVGGVRLGRVPYVRPPTVPPEFDPAAWRASIARLRALRPRRLLLTHFGAFDDPDWHLDDLLYRLGEWVGWAEARLRDPAEQEAALAELRARGDAELAALPGGAAVQGPFEIATGSAISVAGLARYVRKRREARG
ncbi:MAG: MBL fold metallo-hydrolase [Sphaerobacter sp.]|nr:MBL fold metallo-hydrolase [Sphaerobacter sp.]